MNDINDNKQPLLLPVSTPREKANGFGMSIGFVLCGIALLCFPKWVALPEVGNIIFYSVGLSSLLVGILGVCSFWRREK